MSKHLVSVSNISSMHMDIPVKFLISWATNWPKRYARSLHSNRARRLFQAGGLEIGQQLGFTLFPFFPHVRPATSHMASHMLDKDASCQGSTRYSIHLGKPSSLPPGQHSTVLRATEIVVSETYLGTRS